MPAPRLPIVVVGAGVIGASVAYHLATAGQEVVVLERGRAAEAVTRASFGWVGIAKSPASAAGTRARVSADLDRLERELGPLGRRRDHLGGHGRGDAGVRRRSSSRRPSRPAADRRRGASARARTARAACGRVVRT